jgi:hypothetical protein
MRKRLFILLSSVVLSGCTATVMDRHHFATVDPQTNEIVNIFRVTVRGSAQMSNVRYISGYYDQRAVDLFFNEVRSSALPTDGSGGAVESIFRTGDCPAGKPVSECVSERNARLQLIPVGNDSGQQGAFVMILSTSADAIAGTIGAFAETDVVIGSAMYLATRSDRENAAAVDARSAVTGRMRTAAMTELNSLLTGASSADRDGRKAIYLQMLNAAAAGLMPDRPPHFTEVEQARMWFAARPWLGGH